MKILMPNKIVEMDGDEMTRVIWRWIKEILVCPFVELNTDYYDLGLKNRDETNDEVTVKAALAVKEHKVAVKCATITPDARRVEEYGLKRAWDSPNATVRRILDGTVFRTPITVNGIIPHIQGFKKPVTVARHAFGDVYSAVEDSVDKGESAYLVVCKDGKEIRRKLIAEFNSRGIVQGVHNIDASIRSFARSCFKFALENNLPLWFGAKDTVSKIYDNRFKEIFVGLYETEYKIKFEKAGLTFLYTLIDDVAARVIRSGGGMLWACRNYDGDVMSDMIATAYGSLGMMTSVLVSPNGEYEYEAAHGTVKRHYAAYLKGEETSTNPVATIFAWSGALRKRGEIDGNAPLAGFADKLERATLSVIESGYMTGDLVPVFGGSAKKLTTKEFINKTAEAL